MESYIWFYSVSTKLINNKCFIFMYNPFSRKPFINVLQYHLSGKILTVVSVFRIYLQNYITLCLINIKTSLLITFIKLVVRTVLMINRNDSNI